MYFYMSFSIYVLCILAGGIAVCNSKSRLLRFCITLLYIIAVLYYTFFSRMDVTETISAGANAGGYQREKSLIDVLKNVFVMREYDRTTAGFAFNVLLFIPLGYLLPNWNGRLNNVLRIAIGGAIVSFTIEVVQEITGLGMFDYLDLIANLLGTILGLVLSRFLSRHRVLLKNLLKSGV